MTTTQILGNRTLELLLEQIDKSISEHRHEIAELRNAKRELLKINSVRRTSKSPPVELSEGTSKLLVLSTLKKYKNLTVDALKDKVREDAAFELEDEAAARAMKALNEEGKIIKMSDGSWAFFES